MKKKKLGYCWIHSLHKLSRLNHPKHDAAMIFDKQPEIFYFNWPLSWAIIWAMVTLLLIGPKGTKFNEIDNDNDNETMFIAKWHTVHVQRTYVKNRSSKTNIHEIYKTWQRGLEVIVAYVPQYQLYKVDCFGSAEQKQCWVLGVFQYKTLSFMHMYIHIYTSYGTHMHIHIHVNTSLHRESIITVDASMH